MSPQRRAFQDPTARSVLGVNVFEELVRVLEGMDESDRAVVFLRFGFLGTPPMALREVADAMGEHPLVIQMVEGRALRRLRHPSRSRALRDFLDADELPAVPDTVRERLMGLAPRTFRQCRRHGWVVVPDLAAPCEECVCAVVLLDRGRRRRHCSDACRQAAYRRRAAARRTERSE